MSEPVHAFAPATIRVCSQCHARTVVAEPICPACGGQLTPDPASASAERNTAGSIAAQIPPPQTDHRGIVLPPRHAVGGIITPR